jgi:pyruvate,water dikinase
MAVVVQRMVDAQAAGVLFTADPLGSRPSPVIVDAIAGQCEGLVSGHATPDEYVLARDGQVLRRSVASDAPVLTDTAVAALLEDALRAEAAWGIPLDLEWALDRDGRAYWLQARPITTLEDEDGELAPPESQTDIFTTANIGEMMPGAVPPLTATTSFWAVEQGMQEMQVRFGGLERRRPGFRMTALSHGHMFINLSAMAACGRTVAGHTPESLGLAICGRRVPELSAGPKAHPLTRARNAVRYVRYILGGAAEMRRYAPRVRAFRIARPDDSKEAYSAIAAARPFLLETVHMHLRSSSGSGALIGVIEGIMTRGAPPSPEDESALIGMLAGASGVESAELVDDLDRVVSALAQSPASASAFDAMTPADALAWLRSAESGPAGGAFERFLERHGHRSYREADLRQPSWADDPVPLVASIQTSLRARRRGGQDRGDRRASAPALDGRVPEWLLRYARSTVRNREQSKSMMIFVIDEFKRAYRHLARLLVDAGRLPEADLIYFLTHREVGRIVQGADPALIRKARARRRAHAWHQGLAFADISVGPPRPATDEAEEPCGADELRGRPASHGVVAGPARVVRTLEDAAELVPGEVLVAPVTDVGWTPYFGFIAGLATDVGSPISHGAVVAREYGLPAVVNLRTATRTFRTGDRVVLDGTRGTLRRLPEPR